jgi:hypothetical protein
MFGVSGGISQLFTAETRPPSLAAITLLGDRPNGDDAVPGRHPQHRVRLFMGARSGARPSPSAMGGRKWALTHRGGDKTCKANQVLHDQAVDLIPNPRQPVPCTGRRPARPGHVRQKIKVPVFLASVHRRADRRPP